MYLAAVIKQRFKSILKLYLLGNCFKYVLTVSDLNKPKKQRNHSYFIILEKYFLVENIRCYIIHYKHCITLEIKPTIL